MPREGLDPRKILRGYDGELWDGNGNFLADVNTFQAQLSITNSDYQAAGTSLTVAVFQSYMITLTFTETVVRDRLLARLIDALSNHEDVPELRFIGALRDRRNPNRSDGRYAFNNVVPDGTIDIANVTPGEILSRAWAWRVNEPVDLRSELGT